MKKFAVFALLACISVHAFAQKKFPLQWKAKFPFEVERRYINKDRSLILGGNETDIAMINGQTGTVLWRMQFKKKFGFKKATDWKWDKHAHAIVITYKKNKKTPEEVFYLRDSSLETVTAEQYETERARQSWAYKGALGIKEHGSTAIIKYEKNKDDDEVQKHYRKLINVIVTGKYNWNTPVEVNFMRTMCADQLPELTPEYDGNVLKLMFANDKVFLFYEGLSAFDIKSGRLLWQIEFEHSNYEAKVFKSVQTLGRGGLPLITNDAVYLADLTKDKYRIKKFNIENGALLWETESFDKEDVVPGMSILGNQLIVQFGGFLLSQEFTPGTGGKADVCKSKTAYEGRSGIKVYDISNGRTVWQTAGMTNLEDKFDGAMTNIITHEKSLFLATEKHIFGFEWETGKLLFKQPVSKLHIGTPKRIFTHENNVIVQGFKGVASINMQNGGVMFDKKTGEIFKTQLEGNAYVLYTGKDETDISMFVRIDLNTGLLLGKITDTAYPYFTPDGEQFIKFDGNKVLCYRSRK